MATVPPGSAIEAESALLAARAAFDSGSSLPVETRAAFLDKIAVGVKARSNELALAIANNTIYGLGGAVRTGSDEHAVKVARRLSTCQVDINGGMFNANAPFGDYKQLDNGRQKGVYGFEEFLQCEALQFKPSAA